MQLDVLSVFVIGHRRRPTDRPRQIAIPPAACLFARSARGGEEMRTRRVRLILLSFICEFYCEHRLMRRVIIMRK